ncbi:potassium transporter TrkH [Thioclava sp. L04-15]|uniref:TrkH family potassium uptake protein n=1 Tax=Thioclava sp. L04-15 TaxID=1915318 RepID=UPI000996F9B1|nr:MULTISPECIES: TrkH family potassium uptake protein [unclassified Thioclava]MBD3805217.1 TrkH family potassium uptake protein [Thioclava sp.]OOY27459.1 potassium transporter TrkH [Thioclava sp. L04-15]TNE86621.1 MAG: TrkH family potassium uptake protein [Paracoccaceae bacterium]
MIDLRPVGYIIGMLTSVLGLTMLIPAAVDLGYGAGHWLVFVESAVLTMTAGALLALASRDALKRTLSIQQSFVLTTAVWITLPFFGAVPFMLGAPHLNLTDAYFEAMSGLTTTGTTAIQKLDDLPPGVNLWRGLLQWLGGLGIIIVAMIFLPVMKVGGMQFFRSEGFDTLGKILPRAMDISSALIRIYVGLTIACALTYMGLGMTGFDAVMHALTTMSTGGFSNYDASFAAYKGAPEYAASVFMALAAMPFIRFVQVLRGDAVPLWRDPQVRAFIRWMGYAIAVIVLYRMFRHEADFWPTLREVTFNVVSTFTGTGYASEDITQWGHLAFTVLIISGLIGGCTSSTACSVKVFRYLILLEAIKAQIQRLYSPHRLLRVQYDGRPVEDSVVNSVMAFFSLFILSFGVLIIALTFTGLETETAMTAAWTSIANIGPAWGPEITGNGSVAAFPETAKWLMSVAMCVGRLELMSVLVLILPRFWRS